MGAALCLLAVPLVTERWFHWAGLALLVLAWAPWRAYPINSLGILLAAYCAWLLGSALFITPTYSAESVYQPLILFSSFAAVASTTRRTMDLFLGIGLVLVSVLVMVGLLQYLLGVAHLNEVPHRASGTFMTPNTLGTAINLFLAPAIALYLWRGSPRLLLLSLWLFAGLVATESRGAMLALAAGIGFIAILMGRAGMPPQRRGVALLAGFCAVWLVVVTAARISAPFARAAADQVPSVATWFGRATWDRADIYGGTLRLIMEHPLAGTGANTFFPLFETVKPESLRGAEYHFAHCDYLQVWLEFGAPGLVLLMLIVGMALVLAVARFRRTPDDPLPLICGAALATCFAHAVVDFPLYIPFVLLVAGAYLGSLARHTDPGVPAEGRLQPGLTRVSPAIRGTLAIAALAWLAQPAIADIAVRRSISLLSAGDARDALYWQSVARRFEPRHPAHYWAEAIVWREQLTSSANPLFAEEADALFAQGMQADPFDVANLIGRAQLHRRFAALLKHPAPPEEVLAWTGRAAQLRPQHAGVQADYARALAWAGKRTEARALALSLAQRFPNSESVRRLAREF